MLLLASVSNHAVHHHPEVSSASKRTAYEAGLPDSTAYEADGDGDAVVVEDSDDDSDVSSVATEVMYNCPGIAASIRDMLKEGVPNATMIKHLVNFIEND
jgi:hypothetical protein